MNDTGHITDITLNIFASFATDLEETGFYSPGCRWSVIVSHCSWTKPGHSAQWQSISFTWQCSIKYLCLKKRFASGEFNHFWSWAQPKSIMFAFVSVNTFKLSFKRAECAVSVKRWHADSGKYLCFVGCASVWGGIISIWKLLPFRGFYCSAAGSSDVGQRWCW